jgi:hypothetical protein
MDAQAAETKRAAQAQSQGAKAARNVNLHAGYSGQSVASSRKPMEQAAEVVLLLGLYPLTVAERLGFSLLLEQRLRRAYGGPCHE